MPGTYTLRLTASDSALTSSSDVVITVNAPVNTVPVVYAGPNQTITYPNPATLAGTATDDGYPLGSTLTLAWSQVSGPGYVAFANAGSLNTSASFIASNTLMQIASQEKNDQRLPWEPTSESQVSLD